MQNKRISDFTFSIPFGKAFSPELQFSIRRFYFVPRSVTIIAITLTSNTYSTVVGTYLGG